MKDDTISLKEYIDTKLSAIDKSTETAYEAMQVRLQGMNEFRDQLKDQASRFITRTEMDIQVDRINTDLRSLRESRATLEGKASATSVYIAYGFSLIGIVMGVISLLK